MITKCIAVLRAKIEELRLLLDGAELPAETAHAIRAELDRMERILSEYDMKP